MVYTYVNDTSCIKISFNIEATLNTTFFLSFVVTTKLSQFFTTTDFFLVGY